jgi:putative serine protease PepD
MPNANPSSWWPRHHHSELTGCAQLRVRLDRQPDLVNDVNDEAPDPRHRDREAPDPAVSAVGPDNPPPSPPDPAAQSDDPAGPGGPATEPAAPGGPGLGQAESQAGAGATGGPPTGPAGPAGPGPGPVAGPTPEPFAPSPSPGSASARGPRGHLSWNGRTVRGVALAGLAVASGLVGAAGALALDDDDPGSTVLPSSRETEPDVAPTRGSQTDSDDPRSQAAAAVLPSVVSVSVGEGIGGQGSGVLISEDGLVLTNNHVVAAESRRAGLSVTLSDGTTTSAEIVGRDPATDLAVSQLDDTDDLGELVPAELGSSGDLVVGDTVLAVGSPLGLDGSVTSGIVSAVNRAITLSAEQRPFSQGEEPSPVAVIDAIQTDAAVNPGNSGGPLVNADGEVVGINTAIASLADGASAQSGNIGLGFAIPIDEAKRIVEQLVDEGEVSHAYLGVLLADGTGRQGDEDGADASGAVIARVESDGPADEAGVRRGDIVTAVDDQTVRDAASLTAAIRSHDPGDEVTLTVERDGEETTLDVTLGTLR